MPIAFPVRLLVCWSWLAALAAQDPGHLHPQEHGPFRLLDASLDLLAAVGTSSERGATLRELQGGAHDPRQRGFTLQQAEVTLAGALDPWVRAEVHLVTSLDAEDGETIVELEEAFLATQRLPGGLELEAGTWLNRFGRFNQRHPHLWQWQDQPVILTRVFGGEGMRGPGARVSWRPGGGEATELIGGVQNAGGETMTSFLASDEVYAERAIGGRSFVDREVRSAGDLVWSLRAAASFAPSAAHDLAIGASALFGPNATGNDADTVIWGTDLRWRWQPGDERWSFVELQGEWLARAFDAGAQTDGSVPQAPVALPRTTLHDEGAVVQGLWGCAPQWRVGLRGDWATGRGDSYDASTQTFARRGDAFRSDRVRISPLLVWQPADHLRLRLQYNHDDSDHLAATAHSVWLGFEVLLGSHPSHAE